MGQALLQLVPLALAAALSSVPITATIFILLSENRARPGLAFLAGTVIGTFAALSLATVAGQALPGRPHHHEVLVERLEVVVGTAMVVLGVATLARQPRAGKREGNRWLDGIASFGVLPVLGIGLALNLRPKAVLLVAAAGLAISGQHLAFEENLALVVLYTAVATCTVVLPIVATILFPTRMEPHLLAAKEWTTAHSRVVGATMMLLIGCFVIFVGVSD
jgi:hypothetical protein